VSTASRRSVFHPLEPPIGLEGSPIHIARWRAHYLGVGGKQPAAFQNHLVSASIHFQAYPFQSVTFSEYNLFKVPEIADDLTILHRFIHSFYHL
jgi:hypothetical protein